MRIGILGTGQVAATVADGLAAVGHEVVLGSRDPTGKDLPHRVVTHEEAIDGADLVVSALDGAVSLDVLPPLADALGEVVLIDLGNAVTERFELMYPNDSLGRRLQEAMPRVRVVKAMNSTAVAVVMHPDRLSAPTTLFLSGDDEGAKRTVTGLLADVGWTGEQILDLGGIDSAKATEHWFLLFAALMQTLGTPMFNLAIVR